MLIETRPIDTHLEKGLYDCVKYLKDHFSEPKTFVEIGVYQGESSIIFKKAFPKTTFYFIDPWINNYDENDFLARESDLNEAYFSFVEKFREQSNYHIIQDTSDNALQMFEDGSIDILYIDGDHRYEAVKSDLKHWLPKVKNGGAICGHDYFLEDIKNPVQDFYSEESVTIMNNVKRAVDEVIGIPNIVFEDTSWIKRKVVYEG